MAAMGDSTKVFPHLPHTVTQGGETEEVAAEQDQGDAKHDGEQRGRHAEDVAENHGDRAEDDKKHRVPDDGAAGFSIRGFERREFRPRIVTSAGHQVIFAFNTRFAILASATSAAIRPS